MTNAKLAKSLHLVVMVTTIFYLSAAGILAPTLASATEQECTPPGLQGVPGECTVSGYDGYHICTENNAWSEECYTNQWCGDGQENGDEICDAVNNFACTPDYGDSCSYCDNCEGWVAVLGPYCGDEVATDDEECDGTDGLTGDQVCTDECTIAEQVPMTIAKAVDMEAATHGDLVTYNINAYNSSGNNFCEGATLTVTDDITDVLIDADLVSTDATSQDGNVLTWVFDNVACGAMVTGTLTVEVQSRALDGASMVNGTWVRDNHDNSVTSLKVATDISVDAPLLSIIKTVDKALANPSDTITYTVTVSNSGITDAVNVSLVDTLPAGFTFANSDGTNSGDTEKTWTWDSLATGADVAVTYDVLIDSHAGVGTYENIAVATAANYDQEVTDQALTEVRVPAVLGEETPNLTIIKSVEQNFANPGDTANYTVIVTNDGSAPAYNVVLEDVLPTGFVFADTSTQTKTWELGDIVPTESVTITYEVKIDAATLAGKYVNTATVSADDIDGISANADLEIREVQVLGADVDEDAILPVTGGGLAVVLGFALLGAGAIFARRKLR